MGSVPIKDDRCKLRQQTVAFAKLNDRGAVVIGREAEPNGQSVRI